MYDPFIEESTINSLGGKKVNDSAPPKGKRYTLEDFKKEVPQARASVLFDVLNTMAVDASLTNKNKSEENDIIAYDERTLALQHLEYCTKEDLVVMDRGYPSYELFVKYNTKTNFLVRLKKTSFAKAKFLFDKHSQKKDVILEINAQKYLKETLRTENLPTKMKVRFVQIILDNGTVEVLATNVLSGDSI